MSRYFIFVNEFRNFISPGSKASGELIGLEDSVVRRLSKISNNLSSETIRPIETKFHVSLQESEETKVVQTV